ncbi:MAG: NADH-quinone oxidoreductase subunit N [Dehalococcoidia bacterium]|nr:NADH-quinone oxidoreductase subunit N [Dehalococcoidia bacterium]
MDIRLVSPEIALMVTAAVIILLDLAVDNKGVLAAVSLIGIAVSALFSFTLIGNGGVSFANTLIVDDFSIIFQLLFLGATGVVVLASVDYVGKFKGSHGEYYSILLLSTVGMMLLASTRELISIYISLELTGISLFVLSGFLKDAKSSEAGIKFLLLGAVSSATLLYGMAILYALSGTTNIELMAQTLPSAAGPHRLGILLGMILFVAGFGFKMAVVPFQMWVPDVYEGSPTPVTAYLSVASKAAGFAIVLRVFHAALADPQLSVDWVGIFVILSMASMTVGNVVALQQSNIKRMMGYSSISHAGFLLIGLAVVPQLGPSGVLFYLISYAFTNLGAFAAIIAASNRMGSDQISDYAGMGQRAPLIALGLTLCLLSLTGLPPTAGFVAKIYIFNAAVRQGLAWLVLIGVLNSVISSYYYLGVVKAMYISPSPTQEKITITPAIAAAIIISVIGVFLVGIFPAPVMDAAASAISTIVP